MPQIIEVPGMGKVEFPDGMSDDQISSAIRQSLPAPTPVKVGREGFADAVKQEFNNASWPTQKLAAFGTGLSNMVEGAKQIIPGLQSDPTTIQGNRVIASQAPVTAFAGNVAAAAPVALIPGANTYAGAAALGGVMGALQPTMEGESRALNTGLGVVGGVTGKYGGDKISSMVSGGAASEASRQGRNSLKDAALAEAKDAGYVLPKSEIAPTFLNNRLESIAGKAALKQEATLRNQEVTNSLGRKLLGLADDQPISKTAIEDFRKSASEPYRQIADLDNRAAAALEALKKVRNESQQYWTHYNVSKDPDSLNIAKALDGKAGMLESVIDKIASNKGQPGLLEALRESRKKIAQSYDLQRALNETTGDISAPVLGRLLGKDKPLSAELAQVARFNRAFPKFSGTGVGTPAAGVSAMEPMAMGGFAAMGQAATGDARGLLAAGIPLIRGPVRSALLSAPYQSMVQNNYGPGILAQLAAASAPQLPAVGALGAIQSSR